MNDEYDEYNDQDATVGKKMKCFTTTKEMNVNIDLSKIVNVNVDNIDKKDYPDFCDAYISSGMIKDDNGYRELTEAELNFINNECSEFVYEKVFDKLY